MAEGSSVYWLTPYCISMPPSLLARFIKKCSQSNFAWTILVKQLQLTPFWQSVAVSSLKRVKTCSVRTLPRIYQGINEYYIMLFSYSIIYINNIIFISLYSNLRNFRFHVKCSVFVSSTCDICKTKTVIY